VRSRQDLPAHPRFFPHTSDSTSPRARPTRACFSRNGLIVLNRHTYTSLLPFPLHRRAPWFLKSHFSYFLLDPPLSLPSPAPCGLSATVFQGIACTPPSLKVSLFFQVKVRPSVIEKECFPFCLSSYLPISKPEGLHSIPYPRDTRMRPAR